jgi:hypothetical protein
VLGRWLDAAGGRFLIAGVVRNSLYDAFDEPPTPIIYFWFRDRPAAAAEIHVRSRAGDESRLAPDIRRAVRGLDPTLPVYNVRTLGEHVEQNLVFRRIPARIFTVLGPLLLLLAATGIYAVVAYTVSRRRVEIGTRLALGASGPRVVLGIAGDTLRMVGLGAAGGWLLAFTIDRDLIGNTAIDAGVMIGAPVLLVVVACAACVLPAWRASRVAPVLALKSD